MKVVIASVYHLETQIIAELRNTFLFNQDFFNDTKDMLILSAGSKPTVMQEEKDKGE